MSAFFRIDLSFIFAVSLKKSRNLTVRKSVLILWKNITAPEILEIFGWSFTTDLSYLNAFHQVHKANNKLPNDFGLSFSKGYVDTLSRGRRKREGDQRESETAIEQCAKYLYTLDYACVYTTYVGAYHSSDTAGFAFSYCFYYFCCAVCQIKPIEGAP